MKILNKIFGKKDSTQSPAPLIEEKSVVAKKDEQDVKKKLDSIFKDKRNKVCKACEKPISSTEGYKKKADYFWHAKCWKDVEKKAMKEAGYR